MDVRIGIVQSARDLAFETDTSAEEIIAIIEEARKHEGQLAVLHDSKGGQILVNPGSIAYIELGAKTSGRVGFVS